MTTKPTETNDEYYVYNYKQTKTLKDGTVKVYNNLLRKKKTSKRLTPEEKEIRKQERKEKGGPFGRPKRFTKQIYSASLKLSTEDQMKVVEFIKTLQ